MRTINKEYHETALNEMIADCAKTQKKGLPFMAASVILWLGIGIVQLTSLEIGLRNLITFCVSPLLMPLALLFAHFMHVKIADKTNPLSKAGFLFTMNQLLYLLIVMWVYSERPEGMVMAFAIVHAAHMLPFSWLYRSISYRIAAIAGAAIALILGILTTPAVVAFFVLGMQIALVISLSREVKSEA